MKEERYYHTFILSDICCYGFEQPYQQVFAQRGKEDGWNGIFLKYFDNLLIAGVPDEEMCHEIQKKTGDQISTVMGKAEIVKYFAKATGCLDDRMSVKQLYVLEDNKKLRRCKLNIQTAEEKDVDRIYDFLMRIPQLRSMYGQKQMICNRIASGEGEHIFLAEDGNIIAHANSAASTQWSCMIGGVGTDPLWRHRGIGHEIVSVLAGRALERGQIPVIFSEKAEEENLFYDLGFRRIGQWGVLKI